MEHLLRAAFGASRHSAAAARLLGRSKSVGAAWVLPTRFAAQGGGWRLVHSRAAAAALACRSGGSVARGAAARLSQGRSAVLAGTP